MDPDFLDARAGHTWTNFYIWARMWILLKTPDEALAEAEAGIADILARDPLNAEALAMRSLIALEQLRQGHALELANGAVFNKSDSGALRRTLGMILVANGEYEKGKAELDLSLRQSPRMRPAEYNFIIRAYLAMRETETALKLLQEQREAGLENNPTRWMWLIALAQAGRDAEAQEMLPGTFLSWPAANVRWMEIAWKPFLDPAVVEGFRADLLRAGVPLWPYGYAAENAENRLTKEELQSLLENGFRWTGATDQMGGPMENSGWPDGRVRTVFSYLPGMALDGRWRLVENEVCIRYPEVYLGREFCQWMFHDPNSSSPGNPRYVLTEAFGLLKTGLDPMTEE
ncbi:MAG: hypothetical protein GJ676_12585 [Rhodobacteraceae bacterium]|nr:hypothetical protein [Paracoccaceae bacterium]